MSLPETENQIRSLVAYGTAPWQSVLPTLRLVGPVERNGIRIVYGNNGPDVDPHKVTQVDLVVIQRDFPRFVLPFGQILHLARKQHKPVIYEVDDALLDLPEGHVSYSDLSMVFLPIVWAMSEADAITVSTPYLQGYLKIFNHNTWLLPNYLNDDLWTFSAPTRRGGAGDPVIIGYMGGRTHSADLDSILPALERILEIYGSRIRLRFWGGQPPDGLRVNPLVSWDPLDIQDYADFASYFSTQICDIFICPLVNNRFNQAKSALKFLEYSVLGVPGIYSRIVPYENIVEDGENGLLASGIEEWVECLVKLIEDPELRFELGRAAQRTVQQGHLLSQHAELWGKVYRQARDIVFERDDEYYEKIAAVSKAAQQMHERYIQLEREKVAYSEGVTLKTAELEAIYQSHSWKLVQKFRQLSQRLFPAESRWKKFLQKRASSKRYH